MRLQPREQSPWVNCSEKQLRKVVAAAFAQRRKTLRNNLKGMASAEQLEALGLNPAARAETLSLSNFIDIAKLVDKAHAPE